MKIISIGRNPDNDIIIDDNMVSRRHAVLRISPFGKYEIISYGSNGTKVNGNQIVPNQPYPIKRGDSVTFANVANLNWKTVPNPLKPYQYGGIAFLGLIVVCCLCFFIPPLFSGWNSNTPITEGGGEGFSAPVVRNDSVKQKVKEPETQMTELPDFQFKKKPAKKKKKIEESFREVVPQSVVTESTAETPEPTPQPEPAPDNENISVRY